MGQKAAEKLAAQVKAADEAAAKAVADEKRRVLHAQEASQRAVDDATAALRQQAWGGVW